MKIETLNPIKILIYGDERIDFIQNIITNDILNDSKSLYSYILTPQGKILFEIQINFMKDFLEIICLMTNQIYFHILKNTQNFPIFLCKNFD